MEQKKKASDCYIKRDSAKNGVVDLNNNEAYNKFASCGPAIAKSLPVFSCFKNLLTVVVHSRA